MKRIFGVLRVGQTVPTLGALAIIATTLLPTLRAGAQGPTTSAARATRATASRLTTTPTTTVTTTPATTVPATPLPSAASAEAMVQVPAGTYQIGSNSATSEAVKARSITIRAFFIDAFEVTNAQYSRFVDQAAAPIPAGWVRGRIPDGKDDHPVIGVDWEWAQAYCTALSKRLPGDAEWEAAARGPDGRPYPWGSDATAVDLDTPGSRAVGSEKINVSVFGVHDTVGSAWEWVDQPYEPVTAAQRVRRGGEYGRVRIGAAMRQVVDPANASVVAETGFRCAADRTDPTIKAGRFSTGHTPELTPTTGPVTVPVTIAPGVLFADNFENPKSGWTTRKEADFFVGYHAPSWYHVDASKAGVQAMSLLGVQYSDVAIEAKTYVDKVGTPTGRFRYGVVFRATGAVRKPPAGILGPDQPEDFYAFVIDPRGHRWYLLHRDTLPFRAVTSGRLRVAVTAFDSAKPDTLRVIANGRHISLFVNGLRVGRYDTRNFHPTGDIGFYAETLTETRAHVHFDSIEVRRIGQ